MKYLMPYGNENVEICPHIKVQGKEVSKEDFCEYQVNITLNCKFCGKKEFNILVS